MQLDLVKGWRAMTGWFHDGFGARAVLLSAVLVILGLGTDVAAASPPVSWSPEKVYRSQGDGQGLVEPLVVTFEANKRYSDVSVQVVPELEPFVQARPTSFEELEPGVTYSVELTFTIPRSTVEGIYTGTIHLRHGRRTLARPLPIEFEVDFGENVVPPTTKVIGPETLEHLSTVSPGLTTLTFSQSTSTLDGIEDGDVVVVWPSDLIPFSALRQVVDLEYLGDGSVVLTTTQATIEQAFQSASIRFSNTLEREDFELIHMAPLTTGAQERSVSRARLQGLEFTFDVDHVVFDADGDLTTTDDQVQARGALAFDLRIEDFVVDLGFFSVDEVRFLISNSVESEIALSSEIELLGIEEEFELFRLVSRTPLMVQAGPAPVFFWPVLTINLSVDGSITVEVETRATASASFLGGVVYEAGEWDGVSDFNLDFGYEPPAVTAGMNAHAGLGPQLALMVYGVVGPTVSAEGYLELDVEPTRCPHWWKLLGGVQLDVGVVVEAFGRTLADFATTLVDVSRTLARAEECSQPPSGLAEKIVFASDRGGDYDIWMVSPDGEDLQAVVSKPGDQTTPAVSPDGTKLAYVERTSGQLRWVVRDLVTGTETTLDSSTASGNYEWSADGTAIYATAGSCAQDVRRYPLSGGSALVFAESGRDTLWGVDWTSGKLFYSNDPCWSPFIRIKTYDPATATRAVIQGSDGRAENQGNVSLDGDWLTYAKARSSFHGPRRIYLLPTNGGTEVRLTSSFGDNDRFPHFSPTGQQVAFSRQNDGRWGLWLINRDGLGERPVLADGFNNLQPDWSLLWVERTETPGTAGVCYLDSGCHGGNQRRARDAGSGECLPVQDCAELWKCASGPITGSCGGGTQDCVFSPGCSQAVQTCSRGFCTSLSSCTDRIKYQGYDYEPALNQCDCDDVDQSNPPTQSCQ